MQFIGLCFIPPSLVSLLGNLQVYRAGGSGSIPGRSDTQVLKIIEEKVLPLRALTSVNG